MQGQKVTGTDTQPAWKIYVRKFNEERGDRAVIGREPSQGIIHEKGEQ